MNGTLAARIAAKNFSKNTLAKLAKLGIAVTGSMAVAGFEGDWAFTGVAFTLDDNGTGRVRSHAEVLAIAEAK